MLHVHPTIVAIPPRRESEPGQSNHTFEAPQDSSTRLLATTTAVEESANNNTSPTADTQEEPLLYRVATASSSWQYDDLSPRCTACNEDFNALNRRHHCRYCGKIFCNSCSDKKALIPPSQIVLHPSGGKKATSDTPSTPSFSPDPDPDRILTYVAGTNDNTLIAGKGLEERLLLAREPIRVCHACHAALQPLQLELIRNNSNAVRYNYVDPTDIRRLFNSPLAFTLGHEIRKAAYTLNNLLPQPKRRQGAFISSHALEMDGIKNELQQCRDQCNLSAITEENVKLPAILLEQAKGIAVITTLKGGFGVAGFEFGTGLVVVRLAENRWSAPNAIGMAGVSWGALIGAQVSDHVFLLMTDEAVNLMLRSNQQIQLGADVGVAVGPVGRTLEGNWGVSGPNAAPIYTYSLSKGLYAGASLDGKVVATRDDVNEKFYGFQVKPEHILNGSIPPPPAAQPLYEALQRCHVYASVDARKVPVSNDTESITAEYGEFQNTTFLNQAI